MEKKNNGYYKAVGIISYVGASLLVLLSIFFIILVAVDSAILETVFESFYLEGSHIDIEVYREEFDIFSTIIGAYGFVMLGFAAYTFIQASYFIKYSKLTNEEANIYYNKCLAWAICALIFTGWLNGVLAFLGLYLVQRKQKIELEQEPIKKKEKEKAEEISIQKLEEVQTQLAKLAELKNMGAIDQDEFNVLRDKIMRKINAKPQTELDETAQKLKKLQELKDAKAISDEEYEDLKSKIIK